VSEAQSPSSAAFVGNTVARGMNGALVETSSGASTPSGPPRGFNYGFN
jgi:hypothetical protein